MSAVPGATMTRLPGEVLDPGVLSMRRPRGAASGRSSASPREVLCQALASGRGGEVVVRSGDDVGRVYVIDGDVAWAMASGSTAHVEEIVRHAGVTLGDDTVRELIDECRRTGAHFANVLVSWGFLDAGDARECVRRFVAEQLARLLATEDATALFLPSTRAYGGGLRFTWSEVGDATIAPGAPCDADEAGGPACSLAWIRAATVLAQETERIDGVVGVVVLDAESGAILIDAGRAVDESIAGSMLSSLRALGAEGGEVIAIRGETAFVGHTLAAGGALVAQLDLATTNIGLARLSLRRLASARPVGGAHAGEQGSWGEEERGHG